MNYHGWDNGKFPSPSHIIASQYANNETVKWVNNIKQQNTYLEMSKEIKEKYSSIKTIEIDNSKNIEEVKKILKEFINF